MAKDLKVEDLIQVSGGVKVNTGKWVYIVFYGFTESDLSEQIISDPYDRKQDAQIALNVKIMDLKKDNCFIGYNTVTSQLYDNKIFF